MKHRKIPVLFLLVLLAMCFMACAAEKTQKKDSVGNTTQEEPYYYEADGKKIYIGQEIDDAVAILGEDYEYFEAASCAVEGLDMFYYYHNLTLTANEIDGKKIITDIYFKNDAVATTEGIRINMEYAKVMDVYGSDYEMSGTMMEYIRGNTILCIDVRDKKVAAIEYKMK